MRINSKPPAPKVRKPYIGKVAGVLQPVGTDEVRVVGDGDANFFRLLGASANLARRLSGLLGQPDQVSEETKERGGVTFTRRRNKPKIVWTFKEKDIQKVAELLGVKVFETVLEEFKSDEIRVSQSEERLWPIHGRTNDLVGRLRILLEADDTGTIIKITKMLEGVVFTRRMARNCPVWTFKAANLADVAEKILNSKLDKVVLSEPRADEIRVTGGDENFTRLHGSATELALQLNNELGDPGEATEETRGYQGMVFTRRWNEPKKVWTFKAADLPRVAAVLGVGWDEVILQAVQPGEIKAVGKNNKDFLRLHGQVTELARDLNEKLGDPEKTRVETTEYEGVLFTRRQSGAKKIWVFAENDFSAVALILKVKLDEAILEGFGHDEVRIVAKNDRIFSRIHGDAITLARQLNNILGDPEAATEITRLEHGICFTRRYSRANRVWTFKLADLEAVAEGLLGKRVDKTVLQPVKEGEIKVTATDARFCCLHGLTWKIAQTLNSELGEAEDAIEETTTYQDILFTRRRSGGQRVWTCPQERFLELERVLIKEGIINKDDLIAWVDGMDETSIEFSAQELRLRLVSFDSREERLVGLLLKRYSFLDNFILGQNFQVRASGESKHTFDFVVNFGQGGEEVKIVVEHHPDVYVKDERPVSRALSQLTLGRLLSQAGTDVYDLERLDLMDRCQALDEFSRYVRTRGINHLFDELIWPLYYEIKTDLSYAQALRQFKGRLEQIKRELVEFDRLLLAKLYPPDLSH
ncbi:MAG: hypothetical protein WCT39_01205 [Candidatus Margulisiibacteriota bacterium]